MSDQAQTPEVVTAELVTIDNDNVPPWWVPYLFLGALMVAAFYFAVVGRITASEFIAFASGQVLGALGLQVIPNRKRAEIEDVS